MKTNLHLLIFMISFTVLSQQVPANREIEATSIIATLLSASSLNGESVLKLPKSPNKIAVFKVKSSNSPLPDNLKVKYQNIKTFHGYSIDGTAEVILTTSTNKIHGSVSSKEGVFEIRTIQKNNRYVLQFIKNQELIDPISESSLRNDSIPQGISSPENYNHSISSTTTAPFMMLAENSRGATKTTMTIVMTLTGLENEQLGNTTVEEGLASAAAILEYVNTHYRRELALEYILHPDNEQVIYLDKTTDPYPEVFVDDTVDYLTIHNDDVFSKFDENTFDTGYLVIPARVGRGGGRPCNANRAMVASNRGLGLVLHELGHHFSGFHTYDYDSSSDIQRLEISTVGRNSIYFHSANFDNIQSIIDNAACATQTPSGNTPPVVTIDFGNVTIPNNTPYVLSATAIDPDVDADLTYTWQHMQTTVSDPAQSLLYAHETPSAVAKDRYIPSIASILAGNDDPHSNYATGDRNIVSRVVVRDNQEPIGAVSYKEISIDVDTSSGPFLVTSQDTEKVYSGGETVTVNWDVANTDNATIGANNVSILLSIDEGNTYTEILASTANDGTADVMLPDTPSTLCRLKVKAIGNIFYAINTSNFTIVDSTFNDFALTTTQLVDCIYDENTMDFIFQFFKLGSFNTPVNIAFVGLPSGVTSSLTTAVTAEQFYTTTFSGLSGLAEGQYPISIQFTPDGGTETKTLDYVIIKSAIGEDAPNSALSVAADANTNLGFDFSSGPESTNEFTMSLWVKPSAFTEYCGLFFFGESTGINLRSDGTLGYHYEGTDYWSFIANEAIILNEWNHIALTISPNKATFYINGVVKEHVANHLKVNLAKNQSYIGRQQWYRNFTGLIDEVSFYDRTLSAEEVQERMHTTVGFNDPSLKAYYQFNDAEPTLDVRSQILGTLQNGATTVTSTAPVGATNTDTQFKNTASLIFNGTEVSMENSNTASAAAITVSKINRVPNLIPSGGVNDTPLFPDTYWDISTYPAEDLEAVSLIFSLPSGFDTGTVSTNGISLYHRTKGSDELWTEVATAQVNPGDTEASFTTINNIGQFVLLYKEDLLSPDTESPTDITDLTASNLSPTAFDISWLASTDNVAVTGYTIFVDGFLDGTTSDTSYSITGRLPETTYDISVVAFDAAGNESTPATIAVSTPTSPDTESPTAITDLTASNLTPTAFDVSWNVSTDNVAVTEYHVFVDGILDGTSTTPSYSITGRLPETMYSISVVAFDAAGNESLPTAIAVSTLTSPDTESPTIVTDLTVSNLTPTAFDVTWNVSTDNVAVTGYTIFVDGILEGMTSTLSYSIEGVSPETTYTISVVAFDAAGNESIPTAVAIATPTSPIPSIEIVDAFTPNGDGINDVWMIPGIEKFLNNSVSLYNRYGHQVFQKIGYQNTWEGFYKDNTKKIPTGSYYYVINLGDGSDPMSGWVFVNY